MFECFLQNVPYFGLFNWQYRWAMSVLCHLALLFKTYSKESHRFAGRVRGVLANRMRVPVADSTCEKFQTQYFEEAHEPPPEYQVSDYVTGVYRSYMLCNAEVLRTLQDAESNLGEDEFLNAYANDGPTQQAMRSWIESGVWRAIFMVRI